MNKLFIFIRNFVIYLFFISVLAAYPLYKYADSLTIKGLVASMGLFFVLTILSYYIILVKTEKSDSSNAYSNILPGYFLSILLKMFIALIYFWLLLSEFPENELKLASTFFVGYITCTGFEIYYIITNLRQI